MTLTFKLVLDMMVLRGDSLTMGAGGLNNPWGDHKILLTIFRGDHKISGVSYGDHKIKFDR